MEVLLVVVTISLMAAYLGSKASSSVGFEERYVADDMVVALKNARQLAISSRCNVQFVVVAEEFSLVISDPATEDPVVCSFTTNQAGGQAHPGTANGNSDGSEFTGAIYGGEASGPVVSGTADGSITFAPSGQIDDYATYTPQALNNELQFAAFGDVCIRLPLGTGTAFISKVCQ